eukprot:SAG22_NODE_11202_length_496_cov_0.637280_1_plen_40_part_10
MTTRARVQGTWIVALLLSLTCCFSIMAVSWVTFRPHVAAL